MANDININESAILETLNAKIDYDGGNYPSSGLEAQINKSRVSKSGDTMTGNLTIDRGANQAMLSLKTSMVGLGDTPTDDINNTTINMYKKNNLSAILQNATLANGTNRFQLALRNPSNTTWYSIIYGVTADNRDFFEFPKCTTKATTTSSAANDKVAVVVQNYCNGTSWYRVWSDGWKEQGGVFANTTSVTYLKSFSNTNYTIVLNYIEGTSGDVVVGQIAPRRTTTGFTINSSSISKSWYACGY